MNLLENKIKQTNIFHTMYFNNIPSPNSSKILPTSLSLPNFMPSLSLSLKKSPGKEQQNKIKLKTQYDKKKSTKRTIESI